MDEEDVKELERVLDYIDKIVPLIKKVQIKLATELVREEKRKEG